MRVIDPKTEREVTCAACGERLAYWPADVTITEVPHGPAKVTRDNGNVTVIGEWKRVRVVRCLACGGSVEVEGGT